MSKRILSILLSICLVFSMSATAYAKDDTTTSTQKIHNKNVSYIGENKLVLWESGDIVYAEQYDLRGNLIVSGKANRTNDEIIIFSDGVYNKFSAKDIVEIISSSVLPSLYSFNKVGTFPVYDRLTFDRQTMYLYEDTGSAIHTTYSIRSYSGAIASLALSIATSMFIPSSIASKLVSSIISAGLGIVVGEILNISTTVTLAADKYELEYYGQDSKTGKKSDTFAQTDKYIITDEESNKINEIYYDGSCYYDPNDDTPTSKLMQYIVPNLYGMNYEWDRW